MERNVICKNKDGILLPDGDVAHTIYVEVKDKCCTMNSISARQTYIKMQNQLLQDDDCACFLVETSTKQKTLNIKWKITINRQKISHNRIRKVSPDQFYAMIEKRNNTL